MTDAGFFRGTSSEQDNRFSDKEKKLLKQMKFAENLTTKVEMNKIKIDVLKPWISQRICDLLGMEDDVVAEFVVNQLEAEKNPDARKIQINLTGFLNGKNARIFMGELWGMLIAAQESPSGIPPELVEQKKEEIRKRNEDQEKLKETINRTVSHYIEKVKPEKDSPPRSGRRDRSPADRDSKRSSKNTDTDDGGSKRNYRNRRSSSASPENHKRRSRSGSRGKDNNRRSGRPSRDNSRDRGDRRGPDRSTRDYRDRPRRSRSPRPHRRSRSRSPIRRRSRSPAFRSGGRRSPSPRPVRRRSPFYQSRSNRTDSNYRDAPVRRNSSADRDRFRNRHDDRKSPADAAGKDERTTKSGGRAEKVVEDIDAKTTSPEPEGVKDADKEVNSPNSSASSSDKKKGSEEDSEHSVVGEEDRSKKQQRKGKKSKKEKKQHKKDKKHKKHKVKKTKDKQKDSSGSDDSGESDASDEENGKNGIPDHIAQSFLKLVQPEEPSTEDLERKLREKALESMKKAAMKR